VRQRPSPRVADLPPGFLTAIRGIARRGDYAELLDQPDVRPVDLAGNLAHLRLLNRWLGWSAGVWREVQTLLPAGTAAVTLLDVATGSADVPRSLARRAGKHGLRLRLIGSDVSDTVLADARRGGHDVALVRHDAALLPFADGSVDVVTLCLAAHHLDPAALARTLAELWRVARHGVVVSDLERGPVAYAAARLMALVLRNPLTSHDGPISVLRAYRAPELRRIARAAGLPGVRVHRRVPFRLTLVAKKAAGSRRPGVAIARLPAAGRPLPPSKGGPWPT
jgi:SAM-dependent methyltransferase